MKVAWIIFAGLPFLRHSSPLPVEVNEGYAYWGNQKYAVPGANKGGMPNSVILSLDSSSITQPLANKLSKNSISSGDTGGKTNGTIVTLENKQAKRWGGGGGGCGGGCGRIKRNADGSEAAVQKRSCGGGGCGRVRRDADDPSVNKRSCGGGGCGRIRREISDASNATGNKTDSKRWGGGGCGCGGGYGLRKKRSLTPVWNVHERKSVKNLKLGKRWGGGGCGCGCCCCCCCCCGCGGGCGGGGWGGGWGKRSSGAKGTTAVARSMRRDLALYGGDSAGLEESERDKRWGGGGCGCGCCCCCCCCCGCGGGCGGGGWGGGWGRKRNAKAGFRERSVLWGLEKRKKRWGGGGGGGCGGGGCGR